MRTVPPKPRNIAPAERGRIVQHVLVNGWSAAQAAATFGIDEGRVQRWVAVYRRYGMASLKDPAAGEGALRARLWRLRALTARIFALLLPAGRPARCIVLRRRGAGDLPPPSDRSGRRSL